MSSILPAACRNSKFYSISKKQFVLPTDLLRAHGWPVGQPLNYCSDLMPDARLSVRPRLVWTRRSTATPL
eukprot:3899465-Alexandrium_andersonii.AAC.1